MDESTGMALLSALLKAGGGSLVAAGYMTSSNEMAIIGGLIAGATMLWDHFAHASVVTKLKSIRVRLATLRPAA